MERRTERLFRINDEISALRRDEYLAFEELIMLGHLDDDAQRDAAVSGSPLDAQDARETAGDVARMQRHVHALAVPPASDSSTRETRCWRSSACR